VVNPREGWPNEKAVAAASRAPVIEKVRIFPSIEAAAADLKFLFATTARARELAKAVAGPREAARQMRGLNATGVPVGVLFGRERTGLTNDELSLADDILTIPVDPAFSSLNVAQAVLLIAYEWRLSGLAGEAAGLPFAGPGADEIAPKEELYRMFEHFEAALDEAGFFRPPEKRPHMVRALRTMLSRAQLSEQEVRTFRGVVAALEKRPTRPRELPDGTVTQVRGKSS
jgi:tRNA/rRNA methyltransferase